LEIGRSGKVMDYWASFLSERGYGFGMLIVAVILVALVAVALGLFAANSIAGSWR
jgi:hypothetical protein